MKKIPKILYKALFLVATLLIANSCDENNIEYESVYSELFEIQFQGQVGDAIIDYENKTVSLKVFAQDYSTIELNKLIVSKDATTSISEGEIIDFSTTNTIDITIAAANGSNTKTYTVNMERFTSPPFIGNWTVSSDYADPVRIHLMWITPWWEDSHVDAFNLTDSWWNPWGQGDYWSCDNGVGDCYDFFTNGAAVMDNTLSMGEIQEVTEDLKMIGEFIYGPGDDGDMGSYEHTNASTGEVFDFNSSYNVLPSSGIWELDLATNRLVFYNSDRSISTKLFIKGESEGEYTDRLNNGEVLRGNGFAGLENGWEIIDEKFYFLLEIDRSNLNDQWDSFYTYGVPWDPEMDENQHKIHGGFALEFRMKSSN